MDDFKIIHTTHETIKQFGMCGYKNPKKPGYLQKLNWYADFNDHKINIDILHSHKAGTQGMLEYVDIEYCWRPISAQNYFFIHCLFVGFRKEYKKQGFASKMLEQCYQDAIDQKKNGLAVLTRKGSFMANDSVFLNNGFKKIENIKPNFQLLIKKINLSAPNPCFIDNTNLLESKYNKGLFFLRAAQCPYTVKNVNEMIAAAKEKFGLTPTLLNIQSHQQAQQNPSPFGVFCIIYNGKILSHHPISKNRFCNIMEKTL